MASQRRAAPDTRSVTAEVLSSIDTALARWSGMCNLTFTYMGITSAIPDVRSTWQTIDNMSVFGWGQLTNEMAQYGAYTKWWYSSGLMVDADVVINTAYAWTARDRKGCRIRSS